MRCRRWRTVVALLLVGLCVAATACRPEDDSLRRVQQAGVLRVGLDPSWPPFASIDAKGGIVGLDVDLAHAIADRIGVEVAFVPSGWEGLYAALLAGQFDLVISALPYDPLRTEEVAYSVSYFDAGAVIAAPAGGEIAGTGDLDGWTVHVEFGSEGDVQARRLRNRGIELAVVTHDTAREALGAAAADAAIAVVDAVSARLYLRGDRRLAITGDRLSVESYVIAVPVASAALLEAVDSAVIEMRESGELDELLDRWL
jgi:polar amino acid transport system substrate-binding protein